MNAELGLRYEFPNGWTVNEKETAVAHQFVWADNPSAKVENSSNGACSKRLLFVTKHPEGMLLNSFDPMALLIAVDPSCFPAIPYPRSSADHETAQRTAGQILSHLQTPGSVVRAPARVRTFDNGGRVMLEVSRPLSISTNEASLTTVRNVSRSVLMIARRRVLGDLDIRQRG